MLPLRRSRVALYLWIALLLAGPTLRAQAFHGSNPGTGKLPLDSLWRFHAGDDPHWAESVLDDTAWPSIRPDTPWGAQGYAGYTGYAWYRLHLEIRGDGPQMAVFFPAVDDNYEVFFNGVSLGEVGGFPPHAHLAYAMPGSFFLLPPSGHEALSGVLAVRVWKSQLASNDSWETGGLEAPPLLGSPSVFSLLQGDAVSTHDHRFVTRDMLSTVILVAGLISAVLFLRGRQDALYGWLALYLVADAAAALLSTLFWFQFTFLAMQFMNAIRVTACTIALWFLLLRLFDMQQLARWSRVTRALSLLMILAEGIDTLALTYWQYNSPWLRWTDTVTTVIYTLLPAFSFVLLYAGLRRHTRISLWPLAIAVSAYGLYNLVIEGANQGHRYTGLGWPQAIDTWAFSLLGYPVGARSLLDALFVFALLLTVARLHAAERSRRNALELELKSAQEIQRVLVPDELPTIAGFQATAVYQPASEVGGDFYQILPTLDGGILVVIGDVSGKGLKAAMTVSLIVGTIRTLAEISDSPADLLAGLNRRLAGRTAGGFTTCIALHIARSGKGSIANAGHLAPFLNDAELPMEGTLPLGLDDESTYTEANFLLGRGDRLTLFTDGLLEARNTAGELFGFGRVQALMARLPSVQEMMHQASIFGQEDDITLLTIVRSL